MSDSSKTGANSQHHLSASKPAPDKLHQSLMQSVQKLSPCWKLKILELVRLLQKEEQGDLGNIQIIIYENNHLVFQSDLVLNAITFYVSRCNKVLHKACELTISCVYPPIRDSKTSVLGITKCGGES